MSDTKKITVKAICSKCNIETNLTFIRIAPNGASFSGVSVYNCDTCGCIVKGPDIFSNPEFNALSREEKDEYLK